MADSDTFVFFAGVYPNASLAEEDYQTVKDIYYTTNLIDTFDAAVVGKEADGKVKIHKKHEEPTRRGAWSGAGWGLATGLVVALFPAAVIGGGIFGDHCSPISDSTIVSSLASGTDHIDHVRTQLPYALVAAAGAILLYLVLGFLL